MIAKSTGGAAKVGPWGGGGGNARDVEAAPSRLLNLQICSGDAIYAISFSYIGNDGHKHDEGPWGENPGGFGQIDEITIGPLDYVKEISGTTGEFGNMANIIRSLKIVTSKGTYGPYGSASAAEGTPFSIPVHDNGHIDGFFGRSGWYLDAIGVYVRP